MTQLRLLASATLTHHMMRPISSSTQLPPGTAGTGVPLLRQAGTRVKKQE